MTHAAGQALRSADAALLTALKALRASLATAHKQPAYVIFARSDAHRDGEGASHVAGRARQCSWRRRGQAAEIRLGLSGCHSRPPRCLNCPKSRPSGAASSAAMLGARIDKVELRRTDIRFPFPPRFASRLKGRRIVASTRRAKYLFFQLDGEETLIAHLGMSGSFRIEAATTTIPGSFHRERGKDPKHDHVVLHLDNGSIVTYNDPRRFGFMDLVAHKTLTIRIHGLRGLGVEPLAPEFDADRLAKLFSGSRAPLKAALLDQRRIAGLGNIYVCEALFRARISPMRPASILSDARGAPTRAAVALAAAIRDVLEEAVEAGGSTLRDHRQTNGELGYFQHAFRVYDREGLPCVRPGCRGIVARITGSGRSTFYCPVCQK